MGTAEKAFRKYRESTRLGWYAAALHPEGGYGIIWFEFKPERADYWTGEVVRTQREAEAILEERNGDDIVPPDYGSLDRVRPVRPQ